MPAPDTLALFLLASLALNATPGPSIFYVMARSLTQGRGAGLVSAAGLAGGGFLHAIAAALGLSAVFVYSPAAFAVVKYLGAAYLVYLGLRVIFSGRPHRSPGPAGTSAREPLRRLFVQGVVTELLNPKTALFFLAFLPQFVDAARGPVWAQMLLLGLLVPLTALPVDLSVVLAAGALARSLRRSTWLARGLNWVSGWVLVGLGLRLAISER